MVMPIRKKSSITERAGVNYIRGVVEANNSVFKEMDQQYDYGHDAFVLLVEGEQVLPKEIAMQIKSGGSYCTPTTCKIPATAGHLAFWAGHDLETLGVVYDPAEDVAYWVDLKSEARARTRGRLKGTGAVIEFSKEEWNRLDTQMFGAFLVPTLQGKAPRMNLETTVGWARSEDLDIHDLGVKILAARHYQAPEMWSTLLELFRERDPARITPRVWIALVKIIGHHDDGGSYHDTPDEVKSSVCREVLRFGSAELAKLLFHVDDYGFERPSNGYSLMALLGARRDSPEIIASIRDDPAFDEETRRKAAHLIAIYDDDPRWFGFWHKDRT
jgi:hypothetical protein